MGFGCEIPRVVSRGAQVWRIERVGKAAGAKCVLERDVRLRITRRN